MSLVGGFPGLQEMRRRTIRAPVNPMDKCTVISIYPKEINETKHTIEPGFFHLDAGSKDNIAILVVGPSSWWREIDPEQPLLELPVWSIQIADAVVKDFCNGLVGWVPDVAGPGLAYVEGEHNVPTIRQKFPNVLAKMERMQVQWYKELVKITNTMWARSNGNPLVVSDDARLAAKELALQNVDWMRDFTALDMIRCMACGNLRNPEFPVCMHCHNVDMSHPRAKDLVFIPSGGGTVPQMPVPKTDVIDKINQLNQNRG